MAERFRIADDLSEVSAGEWQSVADGLPGFRIELYRSLAASSGPRRFKTFLVDDQDGLRAVAVCEKVSSSEQACPLDNLMFGRAGPICEALHVRTRPHLSFFPPLGAGPAIAVQPAAESVQRRRLEVLLDGIEGYAAEHDAGIGFADIPRNSLIGRVLSARGYLDSEARPTTYMPIEWQNFDGYMAALKRRSANAAKTVRSERRKAQRLGVTIRPSRCEEDTGRMLYQYARRHYHHKNGIYPAYGPDFFTQLAEMTGDDFVVFEACRDGECTGLLGMLRSGNSAWAAWVGFKTIERANDFTYFNLAFYAPAEYAARAGIQTVLYGNAAYDAKLRRGCRMERALFFYRPNSRLMRAVARPFMGAHRAWYRRKFP